ncbi:protein translocase SEC61 complex subunit gamma [Candidatus Woesearchaeota archaeon]|nr:protein translocase SEC61 complex subunit gamma [Candidatus Woesearchaeota archaeon]
MFTMNKLRMKLNEYWRVLRITKKPNGLEFKTIIKVSGLGMAVIGAMGFIIHMTVEVLKRKGI